MSLRISFVNQAVGMSSTLISSFLIRLRVLYFIHHAHYTHTEVCKLAWCETRWFNLFELNLRDVVPCLSHCVSPSIFPPHLLSLPVAYLAFLAVVIGQRSLCITHDVTSVTRYVNTAANHDVIYVSHFTSIT